MTAVSGGDQPGNDGRSPIDSVLERPDPAAEGARPAARPLDQIFPRDSDAKRGASMQETWSAFCIEMNDAVKAVLDKGRSPPEIAYGVGEIVHNFFRTRGLTLTSYELRRLVGELLDLYSRAKVAPASAGPASRPPAPSAPTPVEPPTAEQAGPSQVVTFEKETPATPWAGEEQGAAPPGVPDTVFEPPPSRLVDLLGSEEASFDRLLAEVIAFARPHLARRVERTAARTIIAAAVDKVLVDEGAPASDELRRRLQLAGLSELCGLGLIDRLWADRSVHAVFVNGPNAVYVERGGVLEPAKETFRDEAHLTELVSRLAPRRTSGVAEFQLRDGGGGIVVFPPAAPGGPVLAIRRAEPGTATFERLIAADLLDRTMADLLRIAARSRLNILVSGPSGSGKTALLAALARDMGEQRVVTVARHRAFRWRAPAKIELVAQAGETPFPELLAAGAGLRPDLLVVDSVELEDVPGLVERLSYRSCATVAAVEPESLAAGLAQSVDLVVRLARSRDGMFRVVSMQDVSGAPLFVHESGHFQRRATNPAFAAAVRAAGLGEALAIALR